MKSALREGAQGALRLHRPRASSWSSRRSRSRRSAAAPSSARREAQDHARASSPRPRARTQFFSDGAWHDAAVYTRDQLAPGHKVNGPAIIIEPHQTIVVEPGWQAAITAKNHLVLDARRRRCKRTQARSAPRPIRSCSRCSTTCSCRSPSRWACRCRTPPIRSTSRSGSTSPARCSTPTARWSPTRRTCRCISARWTARSRPSSARTRATSARATSTRSTRPTTAARTCPTSRSARRCSTTPSSKILFWVALARPSRRRRRHRAGLDVAERHHDRGGRRLYRQLQAGRPRPLPRDGAATRCSPSAKYPARNPLQNVNDLKAQIAANEKGVQELRKMVGACSA